MEINAFIYILEVILYLFLFFGSIILAVYVKERNGILAIVVVVAGIILSVLWVRFWIGAEVWVLYPDHHYRRTEWLFEFHDSSGNRFAVERGARYIYYDGLGDIDIPETIELTVFPVFYTTDESKIGLPVEREILPCEHFSLHPYSIQELRHYVWYAFKKIPRTLETSDANQSLDIIWSLDYTENVSDNYVPHYRRLKYFDYVTAY